LPLVIVASQSLPYRPIGFREAKRRTLEALDVGDIQHEPREAHEEKNLLAIGEVSTRFVADLVRSCTGGQYCSSPHHRNASIEVHEFFPGRGVSGRQKWYVKLYFHRGTTFISVHT
jgi:hypothetical protein